MAALGYSSLYFLWNSDYYSAVQQGCEAGNGEVSTYHLDVSPSVTGTCLQYFSFLYESPNIFHNPSPLDFFRAQSVAGTNSQEILVGGSVVLTIPRYLSSRISPSALL